MVRIQQHLAVMFKFSGTYLEVSTCEKAQVHDDRITRFRVIKRFEKIVKA